MLRSTAASSSGRLGIRSFLCYNPCSLFILSTVVVATRFSTTRAFVTPAATGTTRYKHSAVPTRPLFHHSNRRSITMSASKKDDDPPGVQHVPQDDLPDWMLSERTRVLASSSSTKKGKCVVYWMQRDVRTVDNWALLYAAHLAKEQDVPLRVVYCLLPPNADNDDVMAPFYEQPLTERYGSFLLGGLECVHKDLADLNVPLQVIQPSDASSVASSVMDQLTTWQPSHVICDHSPLKPYRSWIDDGLVSLCTDDNSMNIIHVDAHNVVPVWHAAPKRQIGARTLRSKIHNILDTFLKKNEFPDFEGNQHVSDNIKLPDFDKDEYIKYFKFDESVKPVDWAQPGTKAAMDQFNSFTKTGLKQFDDLRNDPNEGKRICSNLSPWINHGHVSFQRLALVMQTEYHKKYANGTSAYVEEGLIRRELSDNFVYYTPDKYDSLESALGWAQETLEVHTDDDREWSFTMEELEESKSHDDLWNAAQLQLVREGKLHGFLRMYWAKKILEWTETPETALKTAQYFNDKYAIDGCDPNGYTGVGWSIMGIHDQGWKEREIFGKIRYMNYAGCKRKFNVQQFVEDYPPASKNAAEAAVKHGGDMETGKKKPTKAALEKQAAAKEAVKKKSAAKGSSKKSSATATKKKKGTKRKSPS